MISVLQVKIVLENDNYSHVLSSNFLFLEDLSVQVQDPVVQFITVLENDDYSHAITLNFIFMEGLSVQDLRSLG